MSPPPHALSCFTSTASPATLPACTSSLAALPSLAALFVTCSTSVTCSTFLLLQHILHLQHVFTCDPPTLHVLPAVLHRSRHPPSCASYRPSCDCSTCGPPTSACCTCTAPAFFFSTAPALSTSAQRHLQARRRPTQPAVAHASSSPSRARCASSSPPSAPRSRLRRCAARREMARPRRRPAIFACLYEMRADDVACSFNILFYMGACDQHETRVGNT